MPAIVLPDVKTVVLDHIRTALAASDEPYASSVTVKGDLPDPRPTRAVTVRADGGNRLADVRGVARLGINVWASSNVDATDLANLVSAIVSGMEGVGPVRYARASLPSEVEDSSRQPLRYITAELIVRGESLQA